MTKSIWDVRTPEGGLLVKRTLLPRIAAAWVVTMPAAALLSAIIFFMIRGALLP